MRVLVLLALTPILILTLPVPVRAGAGGPGMAVSSSGVNCAGFADSDVGETNTAAACEQEINGGTNGSLATTAGGMATLIPLNAAGAATSITILHPVTMLGLSGGSSAGGTVDFELRIDALATPPFASSQIPIRISGSLEATAVFPSNATASITGGGFPIVRNFNPTPSGMPPNPDVAQISVLQFATPGAIIDYGITASCNANSSSDPSQQVQQCATSASATFELDQDEWDATFGNQSFPLEDFYAIDLSPNLVPEPGAVHSVAAAVGALALLARGRRRTS